MTTLGVPLLLCFVSTLFVEGGTGSVAGPVFFTWTGAMSVAALIRYATRCPRCGKRFFVWDPLPFHNPFASRCVNCALPLWADPPGEQGPGAPTP